MVMTVSLWDTQICNLSLCLDLDQKAGHGDGANGNGGQRKQNYTYKAFIGMASVTGFLALALIAFVGNKVLFQKKPRIQR